VISINKFKALPQAVKHYLIITGNYWAFTLTDGALRMLVVLYFYQLGYEPLAIAMLFVFYEAFGVVTNLVGGWLGARYGLNKTMHGGLFLQIAALSMLAAPVEYLSMFWVMSAQALSGIAKDLNKMSAKSSIKSLLPSIQSSSTSSSSSKIESTKASNMYRWVALLTGSKNALKGIGFFIGGLLLATLGFQQALLLMACILLMITFFSICYLTHEVGKSKFKPKFKQLWSKSASLNYLSAARLCLFAARDVWFVVALPVFLITHLDWSHQSVGSFLALWIIGYGIIQSLTPKFIQLKDKKSFSGSHLGFWANMLSVITLLLVLLLYLEFSVAISIITVLLIFGAVFAVNSSLHSFTIVNMADENGISLDVGFYYMANAMGRLFGTVMSGLLYQSSGLTTCLVFSAFLSGLSAYFIRKI